MNPPGERDTPALHACPERPAILADLVPAFEECGKIMALRVQLLKLGHDAGALNLAADLSETMAQEQCAFSALLEHVKQH